jgi:hypothetical protein
MQNGIKYRLLIYDAVSNALVKDVDGTAGTAPSIQVDGGKQYKWYIISTNSADISYGKYINGNGIRKHLLIKIYYTTREL